MSSKRTPDRAPSPAQHGRMMASKFATPVDAPSLHDSALYLSRELSQLDFNFRVLAQAYNADIPLLERLRYMCISCTNLDEFFEIRAGRIRHAEHLEMAAGSDGRTYSTLIKQIHARAAELVQDQYDCFYNALKPALLDCGINLPEHDQWTDAQRNWLRKYFREQIMPVLSPLGLDPAHPFPKILNKTLNVVVVLEGRDAFGREGHLAIVRAPRSLPRIIRMPDADGDGEKFHDFVFLSSVLSAFVDEMFPGMRVKGAYQFRVTRNSELIMDDDDVDNLAHALRDELVGRGYLRAVRLELEEDCPPDIAQMLLQKFELTDNAVYRIKGPVNLNRVDQVYDLVNRPELKFPPMHPRQMDTENLFETIRKGDVLLHHPFDAFTPVPELVRQAAMDPNVLAIKQTLYRTGKDSPIVDALIHAARNGKDVTVVVELLARFDEEANLGFADRLQEAGVQVVYGVVGYKTHAKMMLIVRRENGKLNRYVHMGTGNYHAGTARLYTDIGLMTCHPEITEDVHQIFQQLSGLASEIKLKRLLQSPFSLHSGLLERIEREADHALAGKQGHVIAKMNALNEPNVIRALYRASQAGVKIELIVRGACTLRPGVKGVSENITVRSIIGRFLEHHRVYWFANDNTPEIFCSSADWLERNLLRRVETCFPILDKKLAKRVFDETLANYLADNTQAWALMPDGRYERLEPQTGQTPHSAQNTLLSKTD